MRLSQTAAAQTAMFAPVDAPAPKMYSIPTYKISLVRDGSTKHPTNKIGESRNAASILRTFLGDLDREHFVVMMLDKQRHVIGINLVSIGTLDSAIVHPREVFKAAIVSNASALILCHNHPSGIPAPSTQDRELTHRLVAAGTLLGIPVIDHIVLGDGTEDYYSFADHLTLE